MVVRTLGSGREVSGLYIGARNVRRHFHRDTQHIALTLGDLDIFCDLTPEFWQGRPEIRDTRLAAWLFSRVFHDQPCRAPVPIAMISDGHSSFRVLPFAVPAASTHGLPKIGPALVGLPAPAQKTICSATICRPRNFIACPACTPR